MKQSQHTTPYGIETTSADVARWAYELTRLHARIGSRFARPEPRRRALAYLKGLMSDIERKNGWQIAEHAREATPYGMQRLLSRAVWDADLVRDDVREYVVEQLGDQQAIGVIDETSFLKQGEKSAGVAMQYCGSTGEVDNCQVAVFLAYVSVLGHAFIDRELYLPQAWTADQKRCQEAGIPPSVGFQTKPELATRMLERVQKAQIPLKWVVADTVYGGNFELRQWLHAHGQAHVVAVPCNEPVGIQTAQGRQWLEVRQVQALLLQEHDWQRLCISEGTKGPRTFDWACVPTLHQWQDDGRHWLLIRRSVEDPKEKTYYFVFGPCGTTLQEMVKAIGARWRVEEVFETAKDMGLDHYEVRTWTAWYRHITLVMLAHAFLTSICARAKAHLSALLPASVEEAHMDCPCLLAPSTSACGVPSSHDTEETVCDGTQEQIAEPPAFCTLEARTHHISVPRDQQDRADVAGCDGAQEYKAEQTSLCPISADMQLFALSICQRKQAQADVALRNPPQGSLLLQSPLCAVPPSVHHLDVPTSHSQQTQADWSSCLIPLTVPEVRHLLGRLMWPSPCNANFVLDWSRVAQTPSMARQFLSHQTSSGGWVTPLLCLIFCSLCSQSHRPNFSCGQMPAYPREFLRNSLGMWLVLSSRSKGE